MDNLKEKLFSIEYEINENKIHIFSNIDSDSAYTVFIRDILTDHIAYKLKISFIKGYTYWVMPFQKWYLEYNNYIEYFRGFSVEIFNETDIVFSEKININPKTKTIFIPEIQANLKNTSWQSYREIFIDGIYDHLSFNDVDIALDIGANDGLFTDYLINRGVHKIYAIEPDTRSNSFLREKYKEGNVVISDCAITNEDMICNLLINEDVTCTSKIIMEKQNDNIISVNGYSLKNYILQNNIDNIDFIKMDVEGEEYNIIKSLDANIINSVKYFLIELHNLSTSQITEILDKFNNFDIELRDHNAHNMIIGIDEADNKIVTMYAKNKTIEKQVKIKAIHQLLKDEPDEKRQLESIKNVSRLQKYGIVYKKHLNTRYVDLPPKSLSTRPHNVTVEKIPYALNPSHFGCYNSMRLALLSEFDSDLDAILLFEGDAFIYNHDEFYKKINEILPIANKNRVSYISFGGKYNLLDGSIISYNKQDLNEDFFICDKIIGCQGIMFTSWFREKLKDLLRTEPWDVTDLYLNILYNKHNLNMAVSHNPYVTQLDGISMIDDIHKSYKEF